MRPRDHPGGDCGSIAFESIVAFMMFFRLREQNYRFVGIASLRENEKKEKGRHIAFPRHISLHFVITFLFFSLDLPY